MEFEINAHVRIRTSSAPLFGRVSRNLGNGRFEVRFGGMEKLPAERRSGSPNYGEFDAADLCKADGTIDILSRLLGTQKLVVLGDSGHGNTSAETLVLLCRMQEKLGRPIRIGTIYMEGFYHSQSDGVDESRVPPHNMGLLNDLKGICAKVVGLETEQTAPSFVHNAPTSQQTENFLNNERCTVANRDWAEVLKQRPYSGLVDVVCVGTAHLVSVREDNKVVPSVQEHFSRENPPPAFALAYSASDSGRVHSYKPEGSISGPIWAIEPLDEDDFE